MSKHTLPHHRAIGRLRTITKCTGDTAIWQLRADIAPVGRGKGSNAALPNAPSSHRDEDNERADEESGDKTHGRSLHQAEKPATMDPKTYKKAGYACWGDTKKSVPKA